METLRWDGTMLGSRKKDQGISRHKETLNVGGWGDKLMERKDRLCAGAAQKLALAAAERLNCLSPGNNKHFGVQMLGIQPILRFSLKYKKLKKGLH